MSSAMRAVLRNGLALLLAYVIPRSLMLVAVAVAARVLGAHAFGIYGTAAAFAVILSIASTLGMQPLLVRELARAPERAAHVLRTALVLKTAANAIMLTLLLLIALLLDFPPTVVITALILGVGYAFGSYSENLAAWFQSQERMHVWTQASALFGVIAGLGGAVIVAVTGSIIAFAAAAAAGHLAGLCWLAARSAGSLRRHAAVTANATTATVTAAAPARIGDAAASRARMDPRRELHDDMRRLAGAAAPFALAFVALTLFCKLDVLLLAYWRSPTDVGLYTAAYKFVDLTQALVIVAAGAVLPRLARASVAHGGQAGARTVELAMLAAVPMAGALFLARGPIVHAIFGDAYAAAVPAVALLAPSLPLLALGITAGYVLGVAGAMRAVALSYALALVVKVALGALLIPRAGPTGAAGAALAAEIALVPMLLYALARSGAPVDGRALALGGAAAAIIGAFSLLPDRTGGIAQAVLALIAVTAFYARFNALSDEEVRAFTAAFGSRRSGREHVDSATPYGAL